MEIKKNRESLFEFPVLTGAEAANWDKYSIDKKKIDSRLLMGWAGYALFSGLLRESWFADAGQVHILAGSGNNGGDGYVLAWQILSATRKPVFIWQTAAPSTEDARYFHDLCNDLHDLPEFKTRLQIKPIDEIFSDENLSHNGNIVVDAVFGTGLNKPPSPSLQNIFNRINAIDHLVRIAVDIPSGVYANGDFYDHVVFHAHHTYTFGSYKIGHLLEPGITCCGKLNILPIGFFPCDFENDPDALLQNKNSRRLIMHENLPPLRKPDSHKYDSGTLCVLGGSASMEGATLMAARAFLALGGGLAKIFSPADSLKNGLFESPELMVHSHTEIDSLESVFIDAVAKAKNHVAVIGVGLKETLSQNFWVRLLATPELNVVIDGSGLGQLPYLANFFISHKLKNLVLTPHRAEAERLLEKSITNVREAALEISQKFNAHVYLKGPGGILVLRRSNDNSNEEIYIGSRHHELSTGGTGDVLCGVIANMFCRYHSQEGIEAALNVYGKAAEAVVNSNFNNRDFLTPSEMIHALRLAISRS